jgi:hypothetical protein
MATRMPEEQFQFANAGGRHVDLNGSAFVGVANPSLPQFARFSCCFAIAGYPVVLTRQTKRKAPAPVMPGETKRPLLTSDLSPRYSCVASRRAGDGQSRNEPGADCDEESQD